MKSVYIHHLEYPDYFLPCYTHNVSADASFGLLQEPTQKLEMTLYLIHGCRLFLIH